MELKVWVEGIQRIVCGVNEKTTCQDVVFALAHATGKTGRFTLIERWRNSERLLAPNEQPLKVLLKWGEHSNDVQFILQWSPLDATNSAIKSGQAQSGKFHTTGGVESSCSDNSSSHSPLPASKSNALPAGAQSNLSSGNSSSDVLSPLSQINGPGVKKSTTTGSLSSFTSNVSSESRLGYSSYSQNGQEIPINPSHVVENLTNGDALRFSKNGGVQRSSARQLGSDNISLHYPVNSSGSNGKLLDTGISSIQSIGKLDAKLSTPPPYREPPSPSCHPTPPLSSPNPGMSSPGAKSLPPYREPPPPNVSHLPTFMNKGSNAAAVHGMSPSAIMKGNQPSSFAAHNIHSPMNSTGLNEAIGSGFAIPSQKDSQKYLPISSNLNAQHDSLSSVSSVSDKPEAWKSKDNHGSGGEISFNLNGSVSKSSMNPNPPKSNSQYKDLIRVVNSQREKLTSQQAELTQFDAEIMFWEGKAREQQRHMELINKEISRLEVVSAQHESQVLSLAHLEEENEFSQRESAVLKSEINSLRSELDKCDDEIEKCKQRIRSLVDELHSTQNQMAQRQEEWMQKEVATVAEIERLRRELDLIRRDTDTMNDMSGSLDKEVLSIESSLSEKKRQMEKLIAAMKEANLQSLSIQPPDELIEAHHRSGSTRRMIGSPRQLENAAPTSKNPHGVWV